jgi:hypothetical protein
MPSFGGLDGGERLVLGDVAEHIAERCRAEAELAADDVLECHDMGSLLQATATRSSASCVRSARSSICER